METTSPLEHAILGCLAQLPLNDQQRVLDFASALASTSGFQGVSGKELSRFAGAISKQDAEEMRAAIEEGCEQVDAAKW